eukprot:TRINITY_DN13512_c0_g1_i2.p1 TRINITY_DN13512_c0_g1~~TRINITY_DN13512_c0_g1_i2.p1  ORF type:complete len:1150 (+),score=180.47 TRINITY_DN13512_c0_g1_i2:47-3451(+)
MEATEGVCPLVTKLVYKTSDKVGFSCCTGGALGSQIMVFAGRDDGQIYLFRMIGAEKLSWGNLYNFNEGWREAASSKYNPLWELRYTSKIQVSKKCKPVTQICCDTTERIIFALCDGIVSMLSWDNRECHFLAHVTEDKGVPLKNSLFVSISEHRGKRRLVTTVKKSSKIHIFEYSSEGHITPYTDPLIKPQLLEVRTSEPVLKAYLINDMLCSCTKDEYRITDLTGGVPMSVVEREEKGRKHSPAILPVLDFNEFIIQLDKVSERHSGRESMTLPDWDFIPTSLHIVEPYYVIAASFSDGIPKMQALSLLDLADKEVDTSNAVFGPYSLPISGIRNLNGGLETCGGTGGYFFYSAPHAIYCVSSLPMLNQLCNIVDTPTTDNTGARIELHNAGVLLRHTLRDGESTSTGDEPEQRSSVMCFLCERIGFASLNAGDFTTAFESFTIAYDHDPQYIDAREILILFGLQSVLHTFMNGIKTTRNNLREILEPLRSQEGTYKEEVLNAKRNLYLYLKHTRSDTESDISSPEGSPGIEREVSNEARAIDTALLYLYLDLFEDPSVRESGHTPDPNEFWSILRGNLDYETCSAELRRLGKFRCLAMLKVHEGSIAEALQLLHALGDRENTSVHEEGQDGVAETVHALQQCVGEEGNRLVYEYLPWILERDPQQAIKSLLVYRDPPLNTARVLSLLDTFPDDLVMEYLDHTVIIEGNNNPKYHTKLALKYITAITSIQNVSVLKSVQGGHEAGLLGELRRKLQRLLRISPGYDAVRVLSQLDGTQLHDEMVIAYAHVDEHRSALQILLYKLQNEDRAMEYCKLQYRRALQKHLIMHLGQQESSIYMPAIGAHSHNLSTMGDHLQVPIGHDSPGSPLGTSRKLNASASVGSPRFRSKAFPSADSPSSTRVNNTTLGNSRDRSDDIAPNINEGISETFDLNHAISRPDEFFAIHHSNLPIVDNVGNVFVGIRKHNTYLLELLNQALFPARGDHSERKLDIKFPLRLLEQHYTELDPMLVLKMLPPDILTVSQIQKYLTRVFQQTASLQHEVMIQKNVAKGNKLKHEADRALLLSRFVLIDHERPCAVCGRPMRDGNTSVSFPNLLVTHYKCLQDNKKDPKTGYSFWVDMNIVRPKVKIGSLP